MMLRLEYFFRIFSISMALLFGLMSKISEQCIRPDFCLYVVIGYTLFLIFKKFVYYWPVSSLKNIVFDFVELMMIIFIHWASGSNLTIILYLSFMVRMSILYSGFALVISLLIAAFVYLLVGWNILNLVVDTQTVLLGLYCVIIFTFTYFIVLSINNMYKGIKSQENQLKNLLNIKEGLIRELDQSREKLREYNEQLSHMANTDGLTGVYNYEYFQEYLDNMFLYLKEHDDPLSLLIIDIDRFKEYNDTYGHPAGDSLLKDLAAIFTKCAGEEDVVARYSGDKFAIIMPGQDHDQAAQLAKEIREAVDEYKGKHPNAAGLRLSIGMASKSFSANSVGTKDELIKAAYSRMCANKKS